VTQIAIDIGVGNDETAKAFASVRAAAQQMKSALESVNVDISRNLNIDRAEAGMRRLQTTAHGTLRSTGVDTRNLAAQINDIGVSLASGQSPFLVMVQQGAQISQAFGPGIGVKGAIAGVGTAIMSMVTPVNLALFAFLGLGASAAAYFGGGQSEVEKIDAKLKTHADLIGQIKDRYGDALNSVKAYAAESQVVLAAAAQANIVRLTKQMQETGRTMAGELSKAFAATGVDLNTGKSLAPLIGDYKTLADAARDYTASVRAGTPDVTAFRDRVAAVAQTTADQKLRDFAYQLLDSSSKAGELARALFGAESMMRSIGQAGISSAHGVSEFSAALLAMRGVANPVRPGEMLGNTLKKALDVAGDAKDARVAINEYNAAVKRLVDEDLAKTAKGPAPENAYEKEIEAINKKIAAVRLEGQEVGKSTYERTYATAMLDMNTKAIEANKKAGLGNNVVTAEQTAINKRKATELAQVTSETEKARQAQQRLVEQADATRSSFTDLASTYLQTLRTTHSTTEAWAALLDRAGSMMVDYALKIAMLGLFGPMGTPLGGAGSYSPGILSLFRHDGGPVSATGPMRVDSASAYMSAPRYHSGLMPGEFRAILKEGETVLTGAQGRAIADTMAGLTASARGGGVVYSPVINMTGGADQMAQVGAMLRQHSDDIRRLQRAPSAQLRGGRA